MRTGLLMFSSILLWLAARPPLERPHSERVTVGAAAAESSESLPATNYHLVADETPATTDTPQDAALAAAPPDLRQIVGRILGHPAASSPPEQARPADAPIRLTAAASTPITPSLAGADAGGFDGDSQDKVQVVDGGRLDVRFYNTDLFLALETLGDQTGRNIVLQPGAGGAVSLTLRGVTFEQALDAILRSNNLEAVTAGGVVYVRPAPAQEPAASSEPLDMRLFRLSHVSASEVEEFIKPLVSPEGRTAKTPAAEEGIGASKEKAGGRSPAMGDVIIVVDHPANLQIIEQAIREIDVAPQQVLVEATIMRATLNEQNALGVEFNTLAGVDFQMLAANSPGVGSISLGPVPQPQLQNTSVAARTEFNSSIPQGGFTFGLVKDQVAAFIRALEQITDVSIMANPKVLTLNKQRGEIIVGRRDGYITTTVTETAAVQTVEFLETGTRLIFRPFITRDGRVRMEIHPEDSNGGLTAANLPFQETTEATTNIEVKDGHTILIGGLFRERTTVGKNQVPGIGSIPLIGPFFGVNSSATVREEVIILLTVHILEQSPAEEDAIEQLTQDVERLRVAARAGLAGYGRDQLAEAHYQAAVNLAREGSVDAALFNVRMSLAMRPRHMDAVRLAERLTNERTWASDGSVVRNFLRERLLDQGELTPPQLNYQRPQLMLPREEEDLERVPRGSTEIGDDD